MISTGFHPSFTYCQEPNRKVEIQTHRTAESIILEKVRLVCHVVVLQHFPPLPLELLDPLFLLLGSFYVSLLQQPEKRTQRK